MIAGPALKDRNTSATSRVLIVDDDDLFAQAMAMHLRSRGSDVGVAHSPQEALEELTCAHDDGSPYQLALVDVNMPGGSGLDLLREIAKQHPDVVSVMVTGYGTIEGAVQAVRAGAADYLTKPIVENELDLTLERAMRQQVLASENQRLKKTLDSSAALTEVVGHHPSLAGAVEVVRTVATTNATVLVTGESGTGKSMIARALHKASDRADGPFVEVHCGALPEGLLESELFGHVKGAFTGADRDKDGRFLSANQGTIFLDEINSSTPAMQLRLLRVLQDRCFEPVGSDATVDVDVRVVLACNQSLEQLVAKGEFRQDLYYRVNVVRIEMPSLRERLTDVPLLVEHFLHKHSARHSKHVTSLTAEAIAALEQYAFPGNIRELENIVERCVVLASSPTVGVEALPPDVVRNQPALVPGMGPSRDGDEAGVPEWDGRTLAQAMEGPERQIIESALRANNWNRQETADKLSINRTTLYKKMKALGIDAMGR